MTSKNKITVTVLINGRAHEIEANVNEPIHVLVSSAIKASGSTEKNPDKWVLTTESGEKFDFSAKVGEAGIVAGVTLLLNLKTGAAG